MSIRHVFKYFLRSPVLQIIRISDLFRPVQRFSIADDQNRYVQCQQQRFFKHSHAQNYLK